MNPPATSNDITPQWLTACLKENGYLPHGTVTKINSREPLEAWSGTLNPLEITYSNAWSSAPRYLIFKRWHSTWASVAQHELVFYSTIAPQMSALRVPQLYYAHHTQNDACALYEDFSIEYKVADFNSTPPIDRTQQVIDALAQFHAHWWDHPQLQTQQYQSVQGGPLCMAHMATQDGLREYNHLLQQHAPEFIDAFGDRIPNRWRIAFEWAVANWYDVVSRRPGRHVTLIHGDVHWHNMALHKTTGDLLIFDWETHKRGLGAFDLAYLLHDSYWQG